MHPIYQILAKVSNKNKVLPGDFITVPVDFAFVNDLYLQVILSFREIGASKVWDPSKIGFVMDHYAPSPTIQAAANQKEMRDFVYEQNIQHLFDVNKGVCHQVVPEAGLVFPGMILVGTDSHTTTHGAYGCFSTGVGATDMAGILYTGEMWIKVPEIMKVNISGLPKERVMAKDIMLYIIANLGTDAALYRTVHYTGDTVDKLDLDERLVLCNMSVEMGAKSTYIHPDEKVFDFLKGYGSRLDNFSEIFSENNKLDIKEEEFFSVNDFNISDISPQVALPHQVDNVVSVEKAEGIDIDQVLIGTCTGGRINDIKVTAEFLKGRKISSRTRLLIVPASDLILRKCIELGYIQTLLSAGATIVTPSCGPCLGAHEGIIASGETCISTSSRNFPGRMGSKEADIYLSSPATAAASAITGKITDPRKIDF
ncbi:MAG: 3-isopropylmalate dehydratase large subunit [Atribacterota bacterium]|nr:3-isopropylmalate dehydratase large subunit [Atribacterota bacterium]